MPSISYSRLKQWYSTSPLWVQRAYSAIPFPIRAGRIFRSSMQEIRETEYLSSARLTDMQEERLAVLLKHASDHVPFYRKIRERLGLSGRPKNAFDELHRIPLVTKSDMRDQRAEFVARGGLQEAWYDDNTGGSTGTPLSFRKCNSMYPIEQAHIMALWGRVGYRPGDRKLTLRGRTFSGRRPDQRWQYNPIYNELVISAYHLDALTLAESLEQVQRFRPRFVHGYPSAITTLLRVADENSLPLPENIEAVLCGSEPLHDYQREYIGRSLKCRVFSWYGQSECVLLAGECEESSDYHSFPLYGVLELVDDAGSVIDGDGVEGEIVGTSLNNVAMPFIRYRTGDRGILARDVPCSCGRAHRRLVRVTGRKQHFLYTSELTEVSVTAFVFGQHFAAFERIQGMQLQQQRPGHVLVRIVRSESFSEKDESELKTLMESSVDGGLETAFEYVDRLPVNAAGKTDFVIQEVQIGGHRQHVS